jgi:hypothetical protein
MSNIQEEIYLWKMLSHLFLKKTTFGVEIYFSDIFYAIYELSEQKQHFTLSEDYSPFLFI